MCCCSRFVCCCGWSGSSCCCRSGCCCCGWSDICCSGWLLIWSLIWLCSQFHQHKQQNVLYKRRISTAFSSNMRFVQKFIHKMLMELTPAYDFFLTIILKLFVAFLDEPSFGQFLLPCCCWDVSNWSLGFFSCRSCCCWDVSYWSLSFFSWPNNRWYSSRSIKIFKTTGNEDVDELVKSEAISNSQFGLFTIRIEVRTRR